MESVLAHFISTQAVSVLGQAVGSGESSPPIAGSLVLACPLPDLPRPLGPAVLT